MQMNDTDFCNCCGREFDRSLIDPHNGQCPTCEAGTGLLDEFDPWPDVELETE